MMGPSHDKILPMSSPRHLILPCLMLIVLVNKGANGNFVTPEVTSDLASFIGCNSGRQISVVSVPDPGEGHDTLTQTAAKAASMLLMYSGRPLAVRLQTLASALEVNPDSDWGGWEEERFMKKDLSLYVASSEVFFDAALLDTFLSMAMKRVKKSVLFVPEPYESKPLLDRLRELLGSRDESSYFYLAHLDYDDPNTLVWNMVITLQGQPDVVVNPVKFIPSSDPTTSSCVMEDYDLGGMLLTSTSLSWAPYLTLEGCDENGRNCEKNYGVARDTFNMLARMYNFTTASYRDPDLDWGLYQKGGEHDLTGEWGGVMGDVVLGKHPTSLSEWYHIKERWPILDFVPTTASNYMFLVLTPQPPEYDMDLFIRPFTGDSWASLGVMAGVLLFASGIPYVLFPDYFEATASHRVVNLATMGFFILINAFYGGAMTMFFTSEIRIPFESIRDVLRDETWEVVVKNGNEALYQYFRDTQDPDFLPLLERMEELPEETYYMDVGEGLNMLAISRSVMHVNRGLLFGWLRENPFHTQALHVFGREKSVHTTLILTRNSPMTPMFRLGFQGMREVGTLHQIYTQWEGRGVTNTGGGVDKMVLRPGQVITIFVVLFMAGMTSLALLLLELALNRASKGVYIADFLEKNVPHGSRANSAMHRINHVRQGFMRGADLMIHDLRVT